MPTVKDILDRKWAKVLTSPPTNTVLDATRLMNRHRVGALLVEENGRVVGVFTERDVLTRVVGMERPPDKTRVADVMTTPVAYCTPETPLDECRAIFTGKRIRHLPVLDGPKLVGIITSGDLLAYEFTAHERTIRYLEEYIQTP